MTVPGHTTPARDGLRCPTPPDHNDAAMTGACNRPARTAAVRAVPARDVEPVPVTATATISATAGGPLIHHRRVNT